MKTGILKNGKHTKYSILSNGKFYNVNDSFGLPSDCNNKSVTFDIRSVEGKEKVSSIELEGRKYVFSSKKAEGNPKNKNNTQGGKAFAPYNFVPINDKILPAIEWGSENSFDNNRLSGYLEIELSNITPMFIRGAGDDFVKIDNMPVVPGSTIRGLIRSLVEVVSYSQIDTRNSKYYYRSVADPNNVIGIEYGERVDKQYLCGGFLCRIEKANGRGYDYVIRSQKAPSPEKTFEVLTERPLSKERSVEWTGKEYLVYTGRFGTKKSYYRFFPYDLDKKEYQEFVLDEAMKKSYEEDVTRNYDSLFKNDHFNTKKYPHGYPVFFQYFEDDQSLYNFGHTLFYRIPYDYSAYDLIKYGHELDFTEGFFGVVKKDQTNAKVVRSGRIWFEDLCCLKTEGQYSPVILRPLQSPKPTTFQHYLEQDSQNLVTWNNPNAKLRGFKFYFHRKTSDNLKDPNSWIKSNDITQKEKFDVSPVRPLKPGAIFSGRIRFENLNAQELGAILFVLSLSDSNDLKYCYKIGMGKPLGLGSVVIKVKEVLRTQHTKRYSKLFDLDKWNTALQRLSSGEILELIQSFEKHVLTFIHSDKPSLMDEERVQQLLSLLDFTKTQDPSWNEKTRYMEIERGTAKVNEYKSRPILPKASDV